MFRAIADKCFAMKTELHPAVNEQPAPKLVTTMLPRYDAGTKSDVREALKWLNLDHFEPSELPDWVVSQTRNDSLLLLNRFVGDKTVPSVVGMGLKDALYLLENRGCRVRVEGLGKVRRQSLAPGTRAGGNTTCVLQLE